MCGILGVAASAEVVPDTESGFEKAKRKRPDDTRIRRGSSLLGLIGAALPSDELLRMLDDREDCGVKPNSQALRAGWPIAGQFQYV